MFFSDDDGTHGQELWTSDGTTSGTVMVKDINPGGYSSRPTDLTDVAGTLFFSARDGVHGPQLWKSDGTGAGTVLVRIIHKCSQHVGPDYLTDFKGSAFFSADDGVHGNELWKSDGTSAGHRHGRQHQQGPAHGEVSSARLNDSTTHVTRSRSPWITQVSRPGSIRTTSDADVFASPSRSSWSSSTSSPSMVRVVSWSASWASHRRTSRFFAPSPLPNQSKILASGSGPLVCRWAVITARPL